MLAILTALGGLLGSFLPEVIKYFKTRQDNAHELKIMEMQIESSKVLGAQKLAEVNVQADVASEQAVYTFANPKEGWVAGLNATVRPVVTYLLLGGYLYSKWPHVWWTETDVALFAGVIAFWFGSRTVKHFLNGSTKMSSILPNWQDAAKKERK